jgi:hypothetical protein
MRRRRLSCPHSDYWTYRMRACLKYVHCTAARGPVESPGMASWRLELPPRQTRPLAPAVGSRKETG